MSSHFLEPNYGWHPLARLFFGVFFLLLSAVVLLVNLFRMPGGYDWALGLLDLLTFLGGLLLLCFRA